VPLPAPCSGTHVSLQTHCVTKQVYFGTKKHKVVAGFLAVDDVFYDGLFLSLEIFDLYVSIHKWQVVQIFMCPPVCMRLC